MKMLPHAVRDARASGMRALLSRNANPEAVAQPMTQVDKILHLQRTLGNQRVMRMLAPAAPAPAARRDNVDYGLRTKRRASLIAREAVAYWKNQQNHSNPISDYVLHVMRMINVLLEPDCKVSVGSQVDKLGTFDQTTWTVDVSSSMFSEDPNTTTVGQLTQDEATEIADTVYHEARHAQQFFSMAQVLAGEGKTEQQITAALSIPSDIAQAALKDPIQATPDNRDRIATIKLWEKGTVGTYSNYNNLVNDFEVEASDIGTMMDEVDATTLASVTSVVTTEFSNWRANQIANLQAEYNTANAIPNNSRDEADKCVVKYSQKIYTRAQRIVDEWQTSTAAAQPTVQSVQKFAKKVYKLASLLFKAYKAIPHEKDAWKTGDLINKRFHSEAKKTK